MKTMIKSVRGALLAVAAMAVAAPAMAAGEGPHIERQQWSFSGPFGQYDKAQLQRGFKVYKEVCAACHGARFLSFRNLAEEGGPGFTEDQVKVIAAEYLVMKGPNDDGEMEEVAAIPSDRWPSPFPNQQAARAANGGAYPPDLSLIVKARPGGADYLYALLTGYHEPPADVTLMEGMNYNAYFPGHQIAMAQPLYDDSVTYADGTEASVEQMASDVSTFLAWASEPELEQRKRMGISVMLFLIVLTGLAYASMRKIWADVKK